MPPGEPYYETEGNGINWGVAKTNVARREGVNESNVCYLGDVRSSGSSGGSSSVSEGDIGGFFLFCLVLFVIWVIVEYWWIVIPIATICLIAWLYNCFRN
jgi:hypothetical protein